MLPDPTVPAAAHRRRRQAEAAGVAEALDRATQEATVALAIGTVGACRAIFERTVEYAKVREQYGRPIGSFQALKHRLADLAIAVDSGGAAARYAAVALASGTDVAVATAVAQSYCSDLAVAAAEEAVQLHGGIGMTWEHPAHLYLKRAMVLDAGVGDPDGAIDVLAALL